MTQVGEKIRERMYAVLDKAEAFLNDPRYPLYEYPKTSQRRLGELIRLGQAYKKTHPTREDRRNESFDQWRERVHPDSNKEETQDQ